MRGSFDTYITLDDDSELEVRVSWEGYYERAHTTGLPENCYPASGEMEIQEVDVLSSVEGIDQMTIANAISDQRERLTEEAWEDYHSKKDEGREFE